MTIDIRWKQRFQNFERAHKLLQEIVDLDLQKLSNLEKEGIIQRFQFTLELAWKTLKDKMEYDGLTIDIVSPRNILKLAYQSKYIDHIDSWLDMTADRNLLSHTYDFTTLEKVLPDIQSKYAALIAQLYAQLQRDYE